MAGTGKMASSLPLGLLLLVQLLTIWTVHGQATCPSGRSCVYHYKCPHNKGTFTAITNMAVNFSAAQDTCRERYMMLPSIYHYKCYREFVRTQLDNQPAWVHRVTGDKALATDGAQYHRNHKFSVTLCVPAIIQCDIPFQKVNLYAFKTPGETFKDALATCAKHKMIMPGNLGTKCYGEFTETALDNEPAWLNVLTGGLALATNGVQYNRINIKLKVTFCVPEQNRCPGTTQRLHTFCVGKDQPPAGFESWGTRYNNVYLGCPMGMTNVNGWPIPNCVPVQCPDPQLENGVANTVIKGVYVEFKCDPGYYLKGEPSLFCFRPGTWSNYVPTCVSIDFVGYSYCTNTQSVLRQTNTTIPLQTGRDLCHDKNGTVLQMNTVLFGCADQMNTWGSYWIDYTAATRLIVPYTSYSKSRYGQISKNFYAIEYRSQYILCELACDRSEFDNIATILPAGSVTCLTGYVYNAAQPVCINGTEVGRCTLVKPDYVYSSQRQSIFLQIGQYTYLEARKKCNEEGGNMPTVELAKGGYMHGMIINATTNLWIDYGPASTNQARLLHGRFWPKVVVSIVYLETRKNHYTAVCEIPCRRTRGDNIASLSASGYVICNPGFEYKGSQPVCKPTSGGQPSKSIGTCTSIPGK
ncbi:uncharacterized protein LOC135828525 [Sycon ciliatum]|uniref:uncharacterized protein LOC135828525 n=1 Tax=Sycon ciliatum TaxID=27933 RepID=UPI0031F69C36